MTTTYSPENLTGQTIHALRGTRYFGEWPNVTVLDTNTDGYVMLQKNGPDGARTIAWHHPTDLFPTETAARDTARARRAPRRPKPQPTPLYGDWALLAQFNGITTDGTGRKA